MYSVALNQQKIYTNPLNKVSSAPIKPVSSDYDVSHNQNISFGAPVLSPVRTKLVSDEERQKYSLIAANLDTKGKLQLDRLLKNGRLLNNESDDKTSTLDNLYKIISTQRAQGLDNKIVLKETLNVLENPFAITQKLGDIPKVYENEVRNAAKTKQTEFAKKYAQENSQELSYEPVIPENGFSNSCVSASIEFCLALKSPAEFARFAEGLTSPKVAVEKTVDLKNLTDKTLDSIWLLNNFGIPYKMLGDNKVRVTLAPDKNAIIRARIQNSHKDKDERSLIDALMQSTFMNVGSQQSYDALTDTRGGKFSQNNTGLIEFEKTFTESIVENKNKTSITYQIIDDNKKLQGYTTDFADIRKHIDNTLKTGEPIIVGMTMCDEDKFIIGGHEVTIIASTKDKNGNVYYTYNDTDDNQSVPVTLLADDMVKFIHHAGIPQKVVEQDMKFKDSWVESLENYKIAKSNGNSI